MKNLERISKNWSWINFRMEAESSTPAYMLYDQDPFTIVKGRPGRYDLFFKMSEFV